MKQITAFGILVLAILAPVLSLAQVPAASDLANQKQQQAARPRASQPASGSSDAAGSKGTARPANTRKTVTHQDLMTADLDKAAPAHKRVAAQQRSAAPVGKK